MAEEEEVQALKAFSSGVQTAIRTVQKDPRLATALKLDPEKALASFKLSPKEVKQVMDYLARR